MKFSFQNPTHSRLFFGVMAVILIGLFVAFQMNKKEERQEKPNVVISVPGIGQLPELRKAMLKNRELRTRVQVLMNFDEYYLFSNIREINTRISEIMFIWSGLSVEQLERMNSTQAIEHFLRKSHGLPANAPVQGSPYLPENPWPHYFNNVKARLLMLGSGRNVYEGLTYYDMSQDRMVIEGGLSQQFIKEFKKFLKSRKDAKRYRNYFLVFIDETKGIRNLSAEDKALIKEL